MERSSQRVIHAYAHNASVARQFPDTGANTSFTHLRKDLWRPLWTLSIPEGEHADAQGRHVFKKLREWRKLHETSWEPPALLSLNHSKKEIERLEEQLRDRGGSKKENVYDVIKHKKKKLRVAAVLDQRANSVADLAAVLAAQEALGAKTQQSKNEEATSRRAYQVQTMIDLAKEGEQGGLKKIDQEIQQLQKQHAASSNADEPAEMSKTQLRKQVNVLKARKDKMDWSMDQVKRAKEELKEGSKESNVELSPEQQDARLREMLPDYPMPRTLPKRGPLRARLERGKAPVFSTEGIVIKWANHLDAEYAESWPETIDHQPMGFARNRAPNADQEPIMDVASSRNSRTQAYKASRGLMQAFAEETSEVPQGEISEETQGVISDSQGFNMARGEIVNAVKEAVAARAAKLAAGGAVKSGKSAPVPAPAPAEQPGSQYTACCTILSISISGSRELVSCFKVSVDNMPLKLDNNDASRVFDASARLKEPHATPNQPRQNIRPISKPLHIKPRLPTQTQQKKTKQSSILPQDRPHPRQSAPAPWRASDNRRRRAGQRFPEPQSHINRCDGRLGLLHFVLTSRHPSTGLTPPTQPRGRNHRQSAKRPERADFNAVEALVDKSSSVRAGTGSSVTLKMEHEGIRHHRHWTKSIHPSVVVRDEGCECDSRMLNEEKQTPRST
ncbi:2926_t:CDS:2 [Scutellospora calospora]|uniref:2926_t:CDS:1 n=1 Tax=Scutellospora calospora TaxID=85575 RepID=A0ACA9KFA3_9GLOM|nr:2926_t:CDS:2 [Scutellospora calospora]